MICYVSFESENGWTAFDYHTRKSERIINACFERKRNWIREIRICFYLACVLIDTYTHISTSSHFDTGFLSLPFMYVYYYTCMCRIYYKYIHLPHFLRSPASILVSRGTPTLRSWVARWVVYCTLYEPVTINLYGSREVLTKEPRYNDLWNVSILYTF